MLLNQWCIYPAKFLMMKKDNIELIGFIHHPINMGGYCYHGYDIRFYNFIVSSHLISYWYGKLIYYSFLLFISPKHETKKWDKCIWNCKVKCFIPSIVWSGSESNWNIIYQNHAHDCSFQVIDTITNSAEVIELKTNFCTLACYLKVTG